MSPVEYIPPGLVEKVTPIDLLAKVLRILERGDIDPVQKVLAIKNEVDLWEVQRTRSKQ